MKIKRQTEIETDKYQIGDVISFKLKNREKVQAMAVDQKDGKTVFCFVDCLHQEYPMNQTDDTAEGGYEKSLLRKILNRNILYLFPDEIREKMIPFENGDLLKIPSEVEIFGKNEFAKEPEEGAKQWEPMKDRRNRIAWQGSRTGIFEWYWLRDVVRASSFAYVNYVGNATATYASNSAGIRPAFQI